MRIVFACDHAGFHLKEHLKAFISKEGYEVDDVGAFDFEEGDDYPEYISKAAQEVSKSPQETRAIILGASGQGEAIMANRYENVRAVVYYGEPTENNDNLNIVELSREHNDSNILSLGARFLSLEHAQNVVTVWLETPFSFDERHLRRNKKIDTLEK